MESESILENEVSGHIMAWQKSGLGQMDYCRQNQLVFSRLNYWVRMLCPKTESAGGFVAIKVKKDHPDHSGRPALELVLPGGARVNFYHPVDPSFIKSILF